VLGALGLDVTRLIRMSYGPFQLGELAEGELKEIKGATLREQLGEKLVGRIGRQFRCTDPAPFLGQVADRGDTSPESRDAAQHAGAKRSGARGQRTRARQAAARAPNAARGRRGRVATTNSKCAGGKPGRAGKPDERARARAGPMSGWRRARDRSAKKKARESRSAPRVAAMPASPVPPPASRGGTSSPCASSVASSAGARSPRRARDAIRPTTDRTREALFNVIAHRFAGSSAGRACSTCSPGPARSGIEALSRGAVLRAVHRGIGRRARADPRQCREAFGPAGPLARSSAATPRRLGERSAR
jgi:hypothetical protein